MATSRERVLLTLERKPTDRAPCNYNALPSVTERLIEKLGLADEEELLKFLGVDMRRLQNRSQLRYDFLQIAFAVRTLLVEFAGNRFVSFRIEAAKCQILEFPFQLPDAEAIGQRCQQVEGVLRRLASGRIVALRCHVTDSA